MKPKAKKILKWFGGLIFFILLLVGLAIYTFFCFDNKNIGQYSYCYFVCVSPEIKNFPLQDVIGVPRYGVTLSADDCFGSSDEETFCANPPNKTMSFKTSESYEMLRKNTENYFSNLGYITNLKVVSLAKEANGSEIWFERKNECFGLFFIPKDNYSDVQLMQVFQKCKYYE